MKKKINVLIVIVMISLIFSSILVGCSSSPKNEVSTESAEAPAASNDGGSARDSEAEFGVDRNNSANEAQEESSLEQSGRKVIKSSYMEMETLQFDKTVDAIIRKVSSIGGYVESSNITGKRINYRGNEQNRSARFKLRIPEGKFDAFKLEFGELGNVILDQNNGEDITDQYFDTEARLKSLQIQEERLLEILKEADDIKAIIELERELSDIRYRIENLTGTIRKWDNLVSYATIDLQVYEVYEIQETAKEPMPLSEKMERGFKDSVKSLIEIGKGFLVVLSMSLPYLVIVCIVLGVIFYGKIKLYKGKKKSDE